MEVGSHSFTLKDAKVLNRLDTEFRRFADTLLLIFLMERNNQTDWY